MTSTARFLSLLACFLGLILAGNSSAVAQQAAIAADHSPAKAIASSVAKLRQHIHAIVDAAPAMPRYIADVATTFQVAAGERGVGRTLLDAILILAVGFAAEWAFRRATAGLSARLIDHPVLQVRDRIVHIGLDALIKFAAVLVFLLGAFAILLSVNWRGTIYEAGVVLLSALVWLQVSLVALGLLLRPAEGKARDLAAFELDVPTARFWYRHFGAFVGWFAFGWASIAALRAFGLPLPGQQFLAYLLGLVLVGVALAIVWRRPAPPAVPGKISHRAGRWLASIAIVGFWLVWTIGAMYVFWFGVVAIFMPLTIGAMRQATRHVMRPVPGADGAPGVRSVTAVFVDQGLRAAAIVGGAMILLWGWNLDVGSLAAQEDAATQLLRGGLHALIILLMADLLWNVIKSLADNTLANAQVTAGVNAEELRRRARVRTLLPIGRNVAAIVLLVMAVLMALSALGIDIGPLIASAGVVGVAVGFGCQTVVRDIISGMFYMLDDAFRVGEYIQSGNYKGTVESFSLRSVKLRHQRGPLFTIPFGALGAVQNMSRDWVMVKDQIGITYDSDVDKAKKLIKQIGLDLAKDPDLGPSILQPLKMQGIEQFGQYSINIRLKMMCKPGEQFMVRRRANAMIKKAFDANGIKFAFPTVKVDGGGEKLSDAEAETAAAAQSVLKPAAPAEL